MEGLRRQPNADEDQRASFVELFFDLVFVFVVSRLSELLIADLTLAGAAKTLFLLLVAWWAWIYTTWMTNWFDPETGPVRTVLLVGMLASMFGAIAIPDAFGDRALLLVGGYVAVQTFRNGFCVLATDSDDPLHLPLVRILAWNSWVGAIWLAGALAGEDARVAIWLVALACDYAGPMFGHWTPGVGRTTPTEWQLEPSHFAERLMLFLIIALGESIVTVGVAASQLDLTGPRLLAVIVAFCQAVALWWLYFDFHAEQTLKTLRTAADERGRLGRDLSYLMVLMVAGIIAAAVANEIVVTHPTERLHGMELLALGGGPVLYLLGSVLFKLRVIHVNWGKRAVAAVVVAAIAALGAQLPALATWTLILGVLVALAASEVTERDATYSRSSIGGGASSGSSGGSPS
jgi:low temperature requirement protein LtrA